MSIQQNFPAISPTLTLNFARSKTLDPRVTFTRSSSATRVNPLGLVELVPANSPRFDHSYDPVSGSVRSLGLLLEEQRSNLFIHTEDFTQLPVSGAQDGWFRGRVIPTTESITAPDGSLSVSLLTEGNTSLGEHYVTQDGFNYTSGVTYTWSWYVKPNGRDNVYCKVYNNFDNTQVVLNLETSSEYYFTTNVFDNITNTKLQNGWYRVSFTSTAISTGEGFVLLGFAQSTTVRSYTGDGSSGMYYWGAQAEAGAFPTSYVPSTQTFTSRASSATYFDSTGVLQTAGTNVARSSAFLPDSSGAFRSAGPLLLEEQRTNSIRNNTGVGAVAGTPGTSPTNWIANTFANGITREIVGTGTEDGIAYIDFRFSGTNTLGSDYYQDITFDTGAIAAAQNQSWTQSAYVRLLSGAISGASFSSGAGLVLYGTPSFNDNATFSLAAASNARLATQRFSVTKTFTNALTTGASPRLYWIIATGGTIDFTLRIGLPQLELGAFATSVISTSSATVTRSADASSSSTATRSADNVSITGTNFSSWYNPSEGTVYADTNINGVRVPGYDRIWVFTNSNFNYDGLGFFSSNSSTSDGRYGISGAINGVSIYSPNNILTTISVFDTPRMKSCFGFVEGGNCNISFNGVLPNTNGVTATDFPNVDRFLIGQPQRFQGYSCMTVSQLSYYPRRLSNTQLQALTK